MQVIDQQVLVPVGPYEDGYRMCTKTIMDTSDPEISFDEDGVCNHVAIYEARHRRRVPPPDQAEAELGRILDRIRAAGRGKPYDCIVGVSGGVDSTYTAYLTKQFGLRALAVHLDNGWNSELAVSNIEKLLSKLGIDLYTHVLDWEEFRDLQLSFLKASTPDGEVPTDHAIMGALYRAAAAHGVRYVISGTNIKTEGILPRTWAQGHLDWRYLQGVQARFGTRKLTTFPRLTLQHLFYYHWVRGIKKLSLLDYVPYRKQEALRVLEDELGWVNYGGKHYESVYTRFYQGYILPRKFSIDKRRAHLSTLICSGELSREEALQTVAKPPYADPELEEQDRTFLIKKLGLTERTFDEIMAAPIRRYEDYPNRKAVMGRLLALYSRLYHAEGTSE